MLRALGFRVDALEARVRPPDAPSPLPRTHMLLRVRLGDGDLLAGVALLACLVPAVRAARVEPSVALRYE